MAKKPDYTKAAFLNRNETGAFAGKCFDLTVESITFQEDGWMLFKAAGYDLVKAKPRENDYGTYYVIPMEADGHTYFPGEVKKAKESGREYLRITRKVYTPKPESDNVGQNRATYA